MRRKTLVVTGLAMLAAGVGCGGDDGGGPALSAEAFRDQANAICEAGDKELEEAGKDLLTGAQPETAEIADFFTDKAVPIARRKLEQIDRLSPPADQERDVDEMLEAGEEAIDEVEEGLEDDPAAYLQAKGPDPFDDFDERARELGLDGCASAQDPLPGGEPDTTTSTTPPETTPETTPDTTPTTQAPG